MLVRVPKKAFEEAMEAKVNDYEEYVEKLIETGVIYIDGDYYCYRWLDNIPVNVPVQSARYLMKNVVDVNVTSSDLLHLLPTEGLIVLNARNIIKSYPGGRSKNPNIKGYLVLKEDRALCNRLSKYNRILVNCFFAPDQAFGIEPSSKPNLLQALVGPERPILLNQIYSHSICSLMYLSSCYAFELVRVMYSFVKKFSKIKK